MIDLRPLLALGFLMALPAAGAEPIGPLNEELIIRDHMPGQLLIRFNQEAPSLARLSQALGGEVSLIREVSGDALLLGIPEDPGPFAAAEALKERFDVGYAQPNYKVFPMAVPDDELYQYQWHYDQIELEAAWDITPGDPSIIIAVLDSGITDHPDLLDKRVPGYDMVSNPLIGADGDGQDSDPTDPGRFPIYHGTHVAGTVGADSNNGAGVAGVCWECSLSPVRVLGSLFGTTADIIDGIRWAAGVEVPGAEPNPNPAHVLNMSLGADLGEGSTCALDDLATQEAVDEARAAGAVVIAAAGNSHTDASSFTPANCDGVITVASTGRWDIMPYYSNFGETIEVAAPGGGFTGFIWSTYDQDLYMGYLGTSQASPHVAGLAGLMLSLNPRLDADEVLDILMSTAEPLSDRQCGRGCGAGRVNAHEALLESRIR